MELSASIIIIILTPSSRTYRTVHSTDTYLNKYINVSALLYTLLLSHMSRMKTSNYKSSLGITSTDTYLNIHQRSTPTFNSTLNITTVPYVLDERVKL